jgi:hypothetical protein
MFIFPSEFASQVKDGSRKGDVLMASLAAKIINADMVIKKNLIIYESEAGGPGGKILKVKKAYNHLGEEIKEPTE